MKNKFSTADSFIAQNSSSVQLYGDLWLENTTAILHAPRAAGKTERAIDIAVGLTSNGNEVFYLTTGRIDNSLLHKIAGNTRLYVHKPEFSAPDDMTDYADIVIADIEEAIAETSARIFIIDSLSRIAALSFGRNASPAYIMKRLVALQVRHKISVLVVARDTTRAAVRALVNLADAEITVPDEPAETADSATPKNENKTPKTEKTTPVPEKPAPETSSNETPCDYSMFNHYSPWWDDAVRE